MGSGERFAKKKKFTKKICRNVTKIVFAIKGSPLVTIIRLRSQNMIKKSSI